MKSSKMRGNAVEYSAASAGGSLLRPIRNGALVLAACAAMLLGAEPAGASTAGMHADFVTAITGQDSISYSAPGLPVWGAFTVTIVNDAGNNIPNAIFRFQNNQHTALKVPSIPSNGNASATCAEGPEGPTVIVCSVATGGSPLTFTLQSLSPTAPVSPSMSILWSVQIGQGTDNNSGNSNSGALGTINLVPGNPTELRGYVDTQTPLTVADGAGTQTKVLPSKAATAALKQGTSPVGSCSAQYKVCLRSTITIEDEFGQPITFDPPLIIDLVRDASTKVKGAKIANLVLTYYPKDGSTPYTIDQCVLVDGKWTWITHDRCYIPSSKPANPYTYEDKSTGDWHIQIRGATNGSVDW